MAKRGIEFTNPNLDIGSRKTQIESPASFYLSALENLDQRAYQDSLTKCYNRNFFENFKKNTFDPNRDDNNLCLVFVDLNDLKEINDNPLYGHHFGDQLLKDTADFLKTNFRKRDSIVRVGGDEFIVICYNYQNQPNFNQNFPQKTSDRLNKNIITRNSSLKPGKLPLELAFGIAIYNQNQDFGDIEKTIKRADDLMYQDKKQKKSLKLLPKSL